MQKYIISYELYDGTFADVGTLSRIVVSDLKTLRGVKNRARRICPDRRFRVTNWADEVLYVGF